MNKYISSLIVLAMTAVSVNAGSISSITDADIPQSTIRDKASAEEETSVRDFLMAFYSEIIPRVNNCEGYDDIMERSFTPEFMKTYKTVDEDVPEGEMGFFDCDLISNSQDPDFAKAVIKDLKIGVDSSNAPIANARVSLMSRIYEPTQIDLVLTKTSEGWRISDYNNVMDEMKAFKKEMKGLNH